MHSHRDGYLNALGEATALRAHRQQRAYLSTRPMFHCNGRGPAGGRDRPATWPPAPSGGRSYATNWRVTSTPPMVTIAAPLNRATPRAKEGRADRTRRAVMPTAV